MTNYDQKVFWRLMRIMKAILGFRKVGCMLCQVTLIAVLVEPLHPHVAIAAIKPMVASGNHDAQQDNRPFSSDIMSLHAPRLTTITTAVVRFIMPVDSLIYVHIGNGNGFAVDTWANANCSSGSCALSCTWWAMRVRGRSAVKHFERINGIRHTGEGRGSVSWSSINVGR